MEIIENSYTWSGTLSKRVRTEFLILHHAAGTGSPEAIHKSHIARGYKGIGYNYYVRAVGSIYRGRPEDCEGAHTVGYNSISIGICFEGNFEQHSMPEVQLKAGRELIRDILSRYPGIQIKRHKDCDSTACPGRSFPLDKLTKEDTMTGKEILAALTDEEAYELMTKAQRHAATLDAPEWADKEFAEAIESGITDGERPMQLIPRYQAALMAQRAKTDS